MLQYAPGPTARKMQQVAEVLICCPFCLLTWRFCSGQPFPDAGAEDQQQGGELEGQGMMRSNSE